MIRKRKDIKKEMTVVIMSRVRILIADELTQKARPTAETAREPFKTKISSVAVISTRTSSYIVNHELSKHPVSLLNIL